MFALTAAKFMFSNSGNSRAKANSPKLRSCPKRPFGQWMGQNSSADWGAFQMLGLSKTEPHKRTAADNTAAQTSLHETYCIYTQSHITLLDVHTNQKRLSSCGPTVRVCTGIWDENTYRKWWLFWKRHICIKLNENSGHDTLIPVL